MKFQISAISGNINDYVLFLNEYKFEYRKENPSKGFIVIESLEDLLRLKLTINQELIITDDFHDNPAIEIYDDYRE